MDWKSLRRASARAKVRAKMMTTKKKEVPRAEHHSSPLPSKSTSLRRKGELFNKSRKRHKLHDYLADVPSASSAAAAALQGRVRQRMLCWAMACAAAHTRSTCAHVGRVPRSAPCAFELPSDSSEELKEHET